jgi:oligoendopeptidase F
MTDVEPTSFILKDESTPSGSVPFGETLAETVRLFGTAPAWLEEVTGLSPEGQASLREAWLGYHSLWLRRRMLEVAFEYAMYADPDADLDMLLVEQERRFLSCGERYEGRWASDPFYVPYPVYRQNYLVGNTAAAQVYESMQRDLGVLYPNRQVYEWLRDALYSIGANRPWQDTICGVTGQDIYDPTSLARLLDALGSPSYS